ncbi:MAG TPA: DUF4129 domain-containing protein [Spirochaetales bacterium]|nr:DUF4129 domain-containing protein [Spirochaetales bacterium]
MNGKKGFRSQWLSSLVLLGGLAMLAIGTSKDPPADPVLAVLGKAFDAVDPARAGMTMAIIMQLWLFVSLGLFLAYVAYTIYEHGKYKDGKPRRTFLERMRDPRFAAVAILVFFGLMAGTLYLYRSLARLPVPAESELPVAAAPVSQTQPSAMALELAQEPPPEERVQLAPPPNWLPRLLIGSLGVAALFFATMLVYRYRKDNVVTSRPAVIQAAGSDAIAEAVSKARGRLHLADDVRDAIVGAYADMRILFDRDGQPDAFTPREFARRLLALGAHADAVAGLTALFEKARYSDKPCGLEDKMAALDCLGTLAAQFGSTAEGLASGGASGDSHPDTGDSHYKEMP